MEINFYYDKEDIEIIAKLTWKKAIEVKNLLGWIFAALSIGATLLFIPLFYLGPIAALVVIIFVAHICRNLILSQLEEMPWIWKEQTIRVGEEGLQIIRKDYDCFFKWQRVRKIENQKNSLCLNVDNSFFIVLPKSVFDSYDEEKDFFKTTKQNIEKNRIFT